MTIGTTRIEDAKAAIRAAEWNRALELLRGALRPDDAYALQSRAAGLIAKMPLDGLRPIKVALVGSSTLDDVGEVLRYWMAMSGFAAEIYVAPFDTLMHSVLDETSGLYDFKPDVAWLFTTHRDVRLDIEPGAAAPAVREAVAKAAERLAALWRRLLDQLNCLILQNNADVPPDDPFGNYAGASAWGNRSALRLYNFELGAAATAGVTIFDLEHAASLFGKRRWFDSRFWFHSKHPFALDAIGPIAAAAAKLIAASKGLARKAVVLDLDNTLWGGVIGDDGMEGIKLGTGADGEAFAAFQAYLLALKQRGVILAVCSKNEEATAKEPFEKHPDMKLRLGDIAVFTANWENKADNIRDIATTLNIGLDSLVFVDDNPAEREMVRRYLPMVEVPEMPEDPSAYIEALAAPNYFETLSFSSEDRERARFYQENAMRSELRGKFKDTTEYLRSLDMSSETGTLDRFHLPRMSQLINKSNQFHLTGTRYSEAELLNLAKRPDHIVLYFKLRDRFGDNGLISVLVLCHASDELQIDTWVMSCRVLGRSMEEFICNEISRVAHARGCTSVTGVYRPSPKNKLVASLYNKLGFKKISEEDGVVTWRLTVSAEAGGLKTCIQQAPIAAE